MSTIPKTGLPVARESLCTREDFQLYFPDVQPVVAKVSVDEKGAYLKCNDCVP